MQDVLELVLKHLNNVTNAFSLLVREILKQRAENDTDDDERIAAIRSQSVHLKNNKNGKGKKKGKC